MSISLTNASSTVLQNSYTKTACEISKLIYFMNHALYVNATYIIDAYNKYFRLNYFKPWLQI